MENKTIEIHNERKKLERAELWIVLISGFYCFAGAINQGISSFVLTIPFIIVLTYLVFITSNKIIPIVVLAWFLLCIFLFFSKGANSKLYHPIIGKKVKNNVDICVMKSRMTDESFYYYFEKYDEQTKCQKTSLNPQRFVEGRLIKNNTLFDVDEVRVSNADFGEEYSPMIKTEFGKIKIKKFSGSGEPYFVWEDGSQIQDKELRREILFAPTVMLYFPFLLFAYFITFLNFNRVRDIRRQALKR